jgi:hypothetical protein
LISTSGNAAASQDPDDFVTVPELEEAALEDAGFLNTGSGNLSSIFEIFLELADINRDGFISLQEINRIKMELALKTNNSTDLILDPVGISAIYNLDTEIIASDPVWSNGLTKPLLTEALLHAGILTNRALDLGYSVSDSLFDELDVDGNNIISFDEDLAINNFISQEILDIFDDVGLSINEHID